MNTTAPDAEAFVESARHFSELIIDASSLIVLADIGALETASNTWRLVTIPEAAAEAGPDLHNEAGNPVKVLQVSPVKPEKVKGEPSTDLLILETAKKHHWPLLSEDRKILISAEEAGLPCFDSLVAIELLKGFSPQGFKFYKEWHRRILSRNKYASYRLSWADQIAMAIIKLL